MAAICDFFLVKYLGQMLGSSKLVGEAVRARPTDPARPRTPKLVISIEISFDKFIDHG